MVRTIFDICTALSPEIDVELELRRASNPVEVAFYDHPDRMVSKWHHYLENYDRYMSRYRGKAVRLLELGVHNGGSLQMWRKYLGPDAIIHGIDIDPRCTAIDDTDLMVHIGSQDHKELLSRVIGEMGGVDVVIDDGSHVWSHQIASFEHLYPLLSQDGVYICEDTHTSYWPAFAGTSRTSFVEYAKSLIDQLHVWYELDDSRVDSSFALMTRAVNFYDSMVIIERQQTSKPRHVSIGKRTVIV